MNPPNTYKVECVNHRRGFGVHNYNYCEYFYRWYWQANLRSWVMHHIFGLSCTTLVHNDMREKVKLRKVIWK